MKTMAIIREGQPTEPDLHFDSCRDGDGLEGLRLLERSEDGTIIADIKGPSCVPFCHRSGLWWPPSPNDAGAWPHGAAFVVVDR